MTWLRPLEHLVVTSGFRTARRPTHEGVDLQAVAGTPILAPFAGRVRHYGRDGKGEGPRGLWHGQMIDLNGTWLDLVPDPSELPPELRGHLVELLVLHLSLSYVFVGVDIVPGAAIALSGYTGAVDPPGPAGAHVHLELHVDGHVVSPYLVAGLMTGATGDVP